MNPLIPKIIGGALAVSTIGTGAYFGIKELTKGETLREKLTKEKFRLIGDDADQWELEFKSDPTNIKLELGSKIITANLLKEECQKMLDSRDDKNIDKVKKWCGIRSISNQLLRAQKKFLVSDNSAGAEAKWKATYKKRKDATADRTKLPLEGGWDSTSDKESKDLPIVKKWCKEQENVDYSKTKKETYDLVEIWCTEEAGK